MTKQEFIRPIYLKNGIKKERTTFFLKCTSLKSFLYNEIKTQNTQYNSCIFIVYRYTWWPVRRGSVPFLYKALSGRVQHGRGCVGYSWDQVKSPHKIHPNLEIHPIQKPGMTFHCLHQSIGLCFFLSSINFIFLCERQPPKLIVFIESNAFSKEIGLINRTRHHSINTVSTHLGICVQDTWGKASGGESEKWLSSSFSKCYRWSVAL